MGETARASQQFTASVQAPTGLVGNLAMYVYTEAGVNALAPTTAGIVEVSPEHYVCTRVAPAAAGAFFIRWKYTDTATSGVLYSRPEELVVTSGDPAIVAAPGWDNRPSIERLVRQVRVSEDGAASPIGVDVGEVDPLLLADLLEASIAWIEDKTYAPFNGRKFVERRDGNGSNAISPFMWPLTSVERVKVELPVLALNRVYTSNEVKVYRRQGRIVVFTYKLAAEQVSLHLDRQIYGNILPALPQCVELTYTAGFPQYDSVMGRTTLDGGVTWQDGDLREPRETNKLRLMQQAAIADAAASFLGQAASLAAGEVQSVSFDGFSKSLNPQAYGAQVQALVQRRDELVARIGRRFYLSNAG